MRGQTKWFFRSALLFSVLAPIAVIAVISYVKSYQDLSNVALSRRQAITYLAAATLRGNLDRLQDVSVALATRVRFRQLVGEQKWDEAIQILQDVPKNFPFIERLFLADLDGTLTADSPPFPGVKGQNFAHRDWYKGVSAGWKPYISEVYQRAAEPRLNVIAAAAPIRDEDRRVVGLLVLQVRLDILLDWAKRIDVGPSGFVFLVDRKGHAAAHPKFAPDTAIMDLSSIPTVQKVLRGERGVEIAFNPMEKEERLVAYEPVPGYGWGVIAQEPADTAFAARDSSLRWLLFTYSVIALMGLILAYVILRVLIQRREVEELLKESEERFRGMAEAAYDAIISAGSNGHITYLNHAGERMFGYLSGEVVGRPLTVLMPERFHQAHTQGLKRFLATGEARVIGKNVELVGRKKHGVEFPLELSLSTWKTKDGFFFTGILRDTTERKRFEEELLERNKQVEAANKELEAFSYSVSHDLRAPLRAIDGFSRILLEKHGSEMSPEAQRYQKLIRDNAQQMGRLIDDLLAFSRLSRQALKRQSVAPSQIIQMALDDLRHEQPEGRTRISVGDLPACQADPALLRQLFVNLLSNAIKFTRQSEKPSIEVGFNANNGEPVYFVKDNGVGFDMKYAEKLFGVFQRLHRAEEYEGTGVGLAIVQRIVHRHGGRVWAESEVDKGTTFFFTLGGGAS